MNEIVLFNSIIAAFFITTFIVLAYWLVPSRTRRYRERLVDLYVAGTIRKFATEDKLDLDEEYKAFFKDYKKQGLSIKGLSKVVEEELSEKVIGVQEKALGKK